MSSKTSILCLLASAIPLCGTVLADVRNAAGAAMPLASSVESEDPDILPGGERFPFWSDVTAYSREWHVDAGRGDDKAGDGSAARPFRTINRAAACVRSGQKVVVHAGTYRETVDALAHGGDGPGRMVAFESAGDGEVIVSGAEEWNAAFIPSSGYRQTYVTGENHLFRTDSPAWTSSNVHAKVWCGRFPRSMFKDGENPFAVPLCPTLAWAPMPGERNNPPSPAMVAFLSSRAPHLIPHWLRHRGLLFCDGEMMREVLAPQELWAEPEAKEHVYWVADDGREVHFRLRGDASPAGRRFEATAREQGFAPETRGLAFVRLSGMVFEKFGNGQMPPQRGAVSASWGHHWIVENCTVRDVHTVGIDLGVQSHWSAWEAPRGFDVIRGCRFERCGVHAVCGVPGNGYPIKNVLVEECRFDRVGWLPARYSPVEAGAVKFHFADGCLVRRNIFSNLWCGEAVWLDKCVRNSRITRNVVADSDLADAAFYIECTREANRTDHNAVLRCRGVAYPERAEKTGGKPEGGNFCRAFETDAWLIDRNLIADIRGKPLVVRAVPPDKCRRPRGDEHALQANERLERNIVVSSKAYCGIEFPGMDNASARNLFSFPSNVCGKVKFNVYGREGATSIGEPPDEGSRLAVTDELSLEGLCLKVRISADGGAPILDYSGDLSVRKDFDRLVKAVNSAVERTESVQFRQQRRQK